MQLSERVKDNQSHISIAMQVEFVKIGGRTMLQPVINMVRYDGSLVSDGKCSAAHARVSHQFKHVGVEDMVSKCKHKHKGRHTHLHISGQYR